MEERIYQNSDEHRVVVEYNNMPVSEIERVILNRPNRLSELRRRPTIMVEHRDLSWDIHETEVYLAVYSEETGDSYHGPAFARSVRGGHEFTTLPYEE